MAFLQGHLCSVNRKAPRLIEIKNYKSKKLKSCTHLKTKFN